jgi:hypothetical protein
MNKYSTKRQLNTGSIVLAVLITVSAFFAFMHYQNPSTVIVQEKTVQHRPEAPAEESPSASRTDNRSSSNLMAYNKSVQTFRETTLSEKNDKIYHPVQTTADSQADGSTQDSEGIISSRTPSIKETNRSRNDPDPDYSLPPEEQDDDSPAGDEEFDDELPEDTEPSNQNIAVSRRLVSGSMNEGVMTVFLYLLADSSITGSLTIQETIPYGWEVVGSAPGHNNFNYQTSKITWMFQRDNVMSRIIKYKIRKIEYMNVSQTFNGQFFYNDISGEPVGGYVTGFNLI